MVSVTAVNDEFVVLVTKVRGFSYLDSWFQLPIMTNMSRFIIFYSVLQGRQFYVTQDSNTYITPKPVDNFENPQIATL